MHEELVRQSIALPGGELIVLQPAEAAALPDAGGVEWAPLAPCWSVLWRSGLALARELEWEPLRGLRVVELGCGLGVPSLAAGRAGATVLATDGCPAALALLVRNARPNGVEVDTAVVDWTDPDELVAHGPFDLVLGAHLLYERAHEAPLLSLLPRLAREDLDRRPGAALRAPVPRGGRPPVAGRVARSGCGHDPSADLRVTPFR